MPMAKYIYMCSPIKLNVCLDNTVLTYRIHKKNPRIAWIDTAALVLFLTIQIEDIIKASDLKKKNQFIWTRFFPVYFFISNLL